VNQKETCNIVWLKRDLRTQDHAPFFEAEKAAIPYVIVYILEPQFCSYPDTSLRHLQFIYHSIVDMQKKLKPFGKEIHLCYGEALEVFEHLHTTFNMQAIFSYQESGVLWTFERDKAVKKFTQKHGIEWREFQRDGILRGIKNRSNWEKKWAHATFSPLITNTFSKQKTCVWSHPFHVPLELLEQLEKYPTELQPAGETFAWKYLRSFMQERGFTYSKHISKPALSRKSCGRISPYLAWGNLSNRQAFQFSKAHPNYQKHKRAFTNFQTRLIWRDHFIQKFEVECRYETSCINLGYEALSHPKNEGFIEAWKQGKTGYPLVDACMRCVVETGWINFRMRAMVVSFLCHHLFQDWREGAYFLAQHFLDYEPGIHYPQFQMQAGTTGINMVRIYNPIKQSYDQDATGDFIRKWVPELRQISNEFIHEPWKMTLLEQEMENFILGRDYPLPLVELAASGKFAREQIWGHRKELDVQLENKRILAIHTKRKSTHEDPIRIPTDKK
jgi:deoxyribodipyrimidine photo-lyase